MTTFHEGDIVQHIVSGRQGTVVSATTGRCLVQVMDVGRRRAELTGWKSSNVKLVQPLHPQLLTREFAETLPIGTVIEVNPTDNQGGITKVMVVGNTPGDKGVVPLGLATHLVVTQLTPVKDDWWMGGQCRFGYLGHNDAISVVSIERNGVPIELPDPSPLPPDTRVGDVLQFQYPDDGHGPLVKRVVRVDYLRDGRVEGHDLGRNGGYRAFLFNKIVGPVIGVASLNEDD